MRKGTIRSLYESKLQEAGNDNIQLAAQLTADKLDSLFKKKEIAPEDFSFKALFQEFVDPNNEFNSTTDSKEIQAAVTASAFPTISSTVINAAIIPAYEVAMGPAASLVTEGKAVKTSREEVAGFTAGGAFTMRKEHMSYEEDTLGEKYWSVDKADFGKIISLTREAIFDDRTGDLINRARNIGVKGGMLRAQLITQTLEVAARTAMGESTSQAAVYKGSAITAANFYNADHSALIDKAGTNLTLVTSNALGNSGAINNAFKYFSEFVDENGDKIVISPTKLIYPPALHETALELIFGSVKRTAASATVGEGHLENVWKGEFTPVALPHLSSNTTWYLGSPEQQILWLWVWKPETKVQTDNSEAAFHAQIILRYRFSFYGGCAHTDYRFIVKSTA